MWLWDEWPECPGVDNGIDLVAQSKTDELWGIQAKLVKPTVALAKSSINSFVAEIARLRLPKAIVITATDKVSRNAQKLITDLGIELITRESLDHANVRWPDRLPAAPSKRWRPFAEARAFARKLKLANHTERLGFVRSGRKPADIPSNPSVTYERRGWTRWGDFLGTGNVRSRNWRAFAEARDYVRGLYLASEGLWREYCTSGHKPDDVPSCPWRVYAKTGWEGWGDWLGSGNVRNRRWLSFPQARRYARGLRLRSNTEWREHMSRPDGPADVPKTPQQVYRGRGWTNWPDFLGTHNVRRRAWREYAAARDFVSHLDLASSNEWRRYCRSGERPTDIPANPDHAYRDLGWISWGDFLGTGRVASGLQKWRKFSLARRFARAIGLRSRYAWRNYVRRGKKPTDIPRCPDEAYAEWGWNGWKDWLGYK